MALKLVHFEKSGPDDKDEILAYLESDMGNCLYLTMDIGTYPIGGDVISVWLQRADGGRITAIAMKYLDSFQLYARQCDYDAVSYTDLVALIHGYQAKRVSAPGEIIRRLVDMIGDEYDDSYGVVMEMTKYRMMTNPEIEIEEVAREDIPDAVDVVLSDDMFAQSYERDAMISMLQDHYDRGVGKSYCIRKDGTMVAHLGLAVITDKFVIASYTVVRPEYREYPYGVFLDSYLINEILPSLGKKGFAFMQIPLRIKLFDLMGCPTVGEYGKLLMKADNK